MRNIMQMAVSAVLAPGSLDLSQELNVGNQDPVVYQRFDGSLSTP
jgi:hypothetical protein